MVRHAGIGAAVAAQLDPRASKTGLSAFNRVLVVAILASVAVSVLETEPTLSEGREVAFRTAELAFGVLFSAEYLLRVWLAGRGEGGGWGRRLRWMLTPGALVDVAALLPMLFLPGSPAALLRIARLLRIVRLAKLGRLSSAWALMSEAVHARRYELWLTASAALIAMLVAASLLYLVEGPLQPDRFGSIPRALWWSAMTLTTIGYGDVYPQSPMGKLLASIFAIVGIGLIAAPTGVLAAAFSDAYQRRLGRDGSQKREKT